MKRAFNILLNAADRHRAVSALTQRLAVKDDELWRRSGLATRSMGECYRLADDSRAIEDSTTPSRSSSGRIKVPGFSGVIRTWRYG